MMVTVVSETCFQIQKCVYFSQIIIIIIIIIIIPSSILIFKL